MRCDRTYAGLGSDGSVPILLRCEQPSGHRGPCGPEPYPLTGEERAALVDQAWAAECACGSTDVMRDQGWSLDHDGEVHTLTLCADRAGRVVA